jgi:hypothetical protein
MRKVTWVLLLVGIMVIPSFALAASCEAPLVFRASLESTLLDAPGDCSNDPATTMAIGANMEISNDTYLNWPPMGRTKSLKKYSGAGTTIIRNLPFPQDEGMVRYKGYLRSVDSTQMHIRIAKFMSPLSGNCGMMISEFTPISHQWELRSQPGNPDCSSNSSADIVDHYDFLHSGYYEIDYGWSRNGVDGKHFYLHVKRDGFDYMNHDRWAFVPFRALFSKLVLGDGDPIQSKHVFYLSEFEVYNTWNATEVSLPPPPPPLPICPYVCIPLP